MDLPAALAAFDEQMRRRPVAGPGLRVEAEERLTRAVSTDGSWSSVVWSDLAETDVDATIAAEIARATGSLSWNLYSHDRSGDLDARLREAGLQPDPVQTLLLAEVAELELPVRDPAGVRLSVVDDPDDVKVMLAVHDAVFGPGTTHAWVMDGVRTALALRPRPIEAVLAWAGDEPVSAGRIEFHEGTDFASLWGGGTLPAWRGRGVFRALVNQRALMARNRGFRYLQVHALPASRQILERMGFHPLAEMVPWVN